VGDRILTFGPLLRGSIELAVVLEIALFVRTRSPRDNEPEVVNRS
jgi:hypothetical protein